MNQRPLSRRRNLALLVVGLYLAQSVYLYKIGSKLPIAAKKLSLADRLRRFLRNTAIQVEAYYEPLLAPLLQGLAVISRVKMVLPHFDVVGELFIRQSAERNEIAG